ncbi:2Fe-2S iron-sulfur cluster-binding protein [uncultured Thiodictyon sp.]|uniref:succinate dehydrogenase/fumarate reductase iron-sulfur subunit n=1 Tax=uncultured Thiodictyon sp. TaxID=1846217 RepID=UPI0025F344F2|nr:2Fe-2S iron-sulfur cluster-binding protein [uncultured Thiodictyon sp.]
MGGTGTSDTIAVRVWRGERHGGFQSFAVPRLANQTVLDVLRFIQRRLDPGLAFRHACRVGVCGSCAVRVNGIARWACRTHLDRVVRDDALELAPLDHLPAVRDLVCDLAPFFDQWTAAGGYFVPRPDADGFAAIAPESPARRAVEAGIECIGCGICYSECDTVGDRPEYLGPAALNRAWTLQNDTRDGARAARLHAVSGDAGCHACHSRFACSERCPKGLSPAASIAALKRQGVAALLGGTR